MHTQPEQEKRLNTEGSGRLANTLVVHCGRVLAQAVDEQDILQSVCNALVNDCGFRLAWFGYTEPDRSNSIRIVAQAGDQDGFLQEPRCSETPATLAIQAGETCCIKAIADSPLVVPIRAAALKRGYTSVLSLPLKSDGTLFGALTIYADDPGKLDEPIVERLRQWSDLFALRVKTLRSHQERDLNNDLQNTAARQRLENQLRLIIDTTPALIHTSRPDGYLDYFNKRWVEYLGVSLDNVEGWKWTNSVHPDDVAGIVERWRACLASGEIFEYETRVRRADGEYRWMLHRKVPLRDDGGNIVKWYGSSVDIEEIKQAEDALRRSEFYLDEGQRLAHMGSWSFTPDGICDYWSKELFDVLGFDPANGIPTIPNYLTVVHPDDREFIKGRIERMVAERGGCDETYRILHPQRGLRFMRSVGIPVFDNGSLTRFIGTTVDITEHEQMTQELRRREAFLEEAQSLSHTGSFGWNVTTDEHFWSDETFRIFEYDAPTKITLQLILERVHPADIPLVQQVIARAADGKDFDLEYRLLLPSGSVKYVHVVARAVSDESGNIEFIGAVMDVTERKRAEETLRRSEAYLAEAQKLSHTASFAYNPGRRKTVFWSEELFRIFELDPQRGIPDYNETRGLVHPDDLDRVSGECLQGFREKADFTQDYRLLLHNGTVKHLHVIWHPVLDKDGEVMEYVGTAADVTERKHAEQALRRSEALLAQGQRISHTGSFGWNVSNGEIFWSEETLRIFEYDRTTKPSIELVLERVHPEDKSVVQQLIDRASQDGKDFDFEHRLLMPDGSIKHVHVVAHAIRDELDQIEFVGAVTDITATKIAEQRIQQDEREFREILELTPQHIGVFAPDGNPLYANHAALEYFGVTIDQWRAQGSRLDLVHPDDREHFVGERKKRFLEGAPHEFEARMLRHDGKFRWFLFRLNPLKDERGHITRWYGTATDIEDRKRAEEEIRKENIALREEIDKASMFEEIVGSSGALRKVLSDVAKVAPTDSTVLITGETGTGKELIARAIHKRSRRSSRAFVSVNCAAIPQSLIASELFGHEKGAFTGALQRRLGRFELAEGGTIFLDEIGDLPPDTQNALLRVLQEREFERVGGTQSIRADVRVIAATNSDLKSAMADGTFRSDLFYRFNVFPIEIPPLRERKEDIPMLVKYFMDRYASKAGKTIRRVNKKSLELLQSYPWPGNIRELQNVIERSVIVCEAENLIVDENWLSQESVKIQPLSTSLSEELVAREKERIEAVLTETKGRVSGSSGAAAKLGIPRSTLNSKIRSLKINTHRFKPF